MHNFDEQVFIDMYTKIHIDIDTTLTKILNQVVLHVKMQQKTTKYVVDYQES